MAKETKHFDFKKEFSSCRQDLTELRQHLSGMLHKLAQLSKQEASHVKEDLIDRSKQSISSVKARCRKKPLLTIGYAFSAGLLAGLLARLYVRKKHK